MTQVSSYKVYGMLKMLEVPAHVASTISMEKYKIGILEYKGVP